MSLDDREEAAPQRTECEPMQRTAQFEIQRKCGVPTGPPDAGEWPLPVAVWITFANPLPLNCGAPGWRILAECGALGLDGKVYLVTFPDGLSYTPVVCEHMGRIIE